MIHPALHDSIVISRLDDRIEGMAAARRELDYLSRFLPYDQIATLRPLSDAKPLIVNFP
jgi:hypothetical protein